MSLHYVYSNASNSTLDITQYCRLYTYSASTDAKEGSVAHSTLVVDDKDGILEFVGHRRLYTYEDLAPTNEKVVHNGYIQSETVSRGPYRTGAGRIWTLDLADTNVLLNRRLMNGTDASRPAEDDIDRIVALETMTELNTFDDFLYVNLTAATTPMDAVDYRTQPALQYIDDCAQASGKNYFGWYRESTGDNSLWYDFANSANWQGTKRLSNVLADVDNSTTFAVDMEHDAELDRDPSRVASGVMLPFDGVASGSNTINGTVYVQNPTTTATFAAIDWLAPSVNVKTKAKALARANRYLADADTEDDLIHASVKLPSANVNDFMAGMRFDAKFSHLPGYSSFRSFRCLSRVVNEISEDPTRAYRLDLELSPIGESALEQYFTESHPEGGCAPGQWPADPGAGNLLIGFVAVRGTSATPTAPEGSSADDCSSGTIAGHDWTSFASAVMVGAGNSPIAGAWRIGTAGEPQNTRWGATAGGSRPRLHHIEVAGLALGAPTDSATRSAGNSLTSPSVTATGPGYVFGMYANISGHGAPGDFGDSPTTDMDAVAPAVTLTKGFASPTFAPYSICVALRVEAAGSYTVSLTSTRSLDGSGDAWIVAYWPDA